MNAMLLASSGGALTKDYYTSEGYRTTGSIVWNTAESNFGGKVGTVKFTVDVYLRLINDGVKSYCDINKYIRSEQKNNDHTNRRFNK